MMSSRQRSAFADLPPELLWVVFSYLDYVDIPSVDCSCSLFHSVFQNQNFWRLLAIQRFEFLSGVVDLSSIGSQLLGGLVEEDDPILLSPFFVEHFGSWKECVQGVWFLTEGSDAWILPNEAIMTDSNSSSKGDADESEEPALDFLTILSRKEPKNRCSKKMTRELIDSQVVYSPGEVEGQIVPPSNMIFGLPVEAPQVAIGFHVTFSHDPDLKIGVSSAKPEEEESEEDEVRPVRKWVSVTELYHHLGLAEQYVRRKRSTRMHGIFKMAVDGIHESLKNRVSGCLEFEPFLENMTRIPRRGLEGKCWGLTRGGSPLLAIGLVFDLCEVSTLAYLQESLLGFVRGSPDTAWKGPVVLIGANARRYVRGPLDYKCVTLKDVREFQAKVAEPRAGNGVDVLYAGCLPDECEGDDEDANARSLQILKVLLKYTVLVFGRELEGAFHWEPVDENPIRTLWDQWE